MLIKLSTNFPGEPIIRQTPGNRGVWKGSQFLINDPGATECDFWVVLEGVSQDETAFVRSGVTVFFALEPPAREEYQTGFLKQFDLVIASHPKLRHRNFRNDCQGLPWHVGIDRGPQGDRYLNPIRCTIDYDKFVAMQPVEKTALMSVVLSTLTHLPGQRERLQFVEALKQKWGDDIHVYGRGINPIRDKFDAIAPYKYNIVLENSVAPHYWSEKLADCFLSFAYPIYWGCPNVHDYFPAGSLSAIDIFHRDKALAVVADVVARDLAAQNRSALLEARELVLTRYNLFELARKACLSVPPKGSRTMTIRPDMTFYNPYEIRRLMRRIPRIPGKVKRILRRSITTARAQ